MQMMYTQEIQLLLLLVQNIFDIYKSKYLCETE
jgi:hypothetical protein